MSPARPRRPHEDIEQWFETLCCGGCQAARLLSWSVDPDALSFADEKDRPQHGVSIGEHIAVVHCDYFKRRVEQPDKLTYCAARRSG